jgi:hypothetical protein
MHVPYSWLSDQVDIRDVAVTLFNGRQVCRMEPRTAIQVRRLTFSSGWLPLIRLPVPTFPLAAPLAAKCFNELNRDFHPGSQQLRRNPLVLQERTLGVEDVQKTYSTFLILLLA